MITIRRNRNFVLVFSAIWISSNLQAGVVGPGRSGGESFSPAVVQGWTASIGGLFGSQAPDLMTLNPILSSLKGVDLSDQKTSEALAPVYAAVQSQVQALQANVLPAQATLANTAIATKYVALDILKDFQLPETRGPVEDRSRVYHNALPNEEKEQIRSKLLKLKMEAMAKALGQTDEVNSATSVVAGNSSRKQMSLRPAAKRIAVSDPVRKRANHITLAKSNTPAHISLGTLARYRDLIAAEGAAEIYLRNSSIIEDTSASAVGAEGRVAAQNTTSVLQRELANIRIEKAAIEALHPDIAPMKLREEGEWKWLTNSWRRLTQAWTGNSPTHTPQEPLARYRDLIAAEGAAESYLRNSSTMEDASARAVGAEGRVAAQAATSVLQRELANIRNEKTVLEALYPDIVYGRSSRLRRLALFLGSLLNATQSSGRETSNLRGNGP